MREYGYAPVTADKTLNERIYQMHWEDELPDAEVLDFVRSQGIKPPFDPDRFPQPFAIVWEDDGPVVEWPDVNAPVEYAREYLVEGSAEQLAELHRLRDAFDAELTRRVRDLDGGPVIQTDEGVLTYSDEITPRDRDYDLRALVKRLGLAPPDPVRPWEVAVRYEAGKPVLVWHDWTHSWPVIAPAELLHDLVAARDSQDLDSDGLTAYARSKGLTPPFRADLHWSISFGAQPTDFSWVPPYDYALRIG